MQRQTARSSSAETVARGLAMRYLGSCSECGAMRCRRSTPPPGAASAALRLCHWSSWQVNPMLGLATPRKPGLVTLGEVIQTVDSEQGQTSNIVYFEVVRRSLYASCRSPFGRTQTRRRCTHLQPTQQHPPFHRKPRPAWSAAKIRTTGN